MLQLYVVGFAVGVLTVFFDVAYQSYLPALVDRERLVEGNAKLEISRSAAAVAGPPVGGALVGVLSAPIAILLDALSFLASAIFLFAIRKPEPAPEPHLDEAGERVGMAAVDPRGPGLRRQRTDCCATSRPRPASATSSAPSASPSSCSTSCGTWA